MEEKNNILLCQNCGTLNAEKAPWCKVCGRELGPTSIRILPKGTLLDQGRYIISGYLGHGGSVITYRARQKNFTAEVAIREYYPSSFVKRYGSSFEVRPIGPAEELAFEQGKTQFFNEGNNLRTLGRIPNIVQVYDVFEDNGTVYMAEDYISGESLSDILEKKRKLSFKAAMAFIKPVLKALMQVHRQGIIHRDIKPSNIMISGSKPYLIDFGISKRITKNTTVSIHHRNIQECGQAAFTRGYAAPEQITGQAREGAWTDVYGLAATLYRMVTGTDPDDAEARLVRDLLPHPIDVGADLTREQSDAIMTGLALDTITRFQTVQAFLAALTIKKHTPDSSERSKDVYVTEPTKKRDIRIWIAVGGVIILTALGLWKREFLIENLFGETTEDYDQPSYHLTNEVSVGDNVIVLDQSINLYKKTSIHSEVLYRFTKGDEFSVSGDWGAGWYRCSCYVNNDNSESNLLEGYVLFNNNALQKIGVIDYENSQMTNEISVGDEVIVLNNTVHLYEKSNIYSNVLYRFTKGDEFTVNEEIGNGWFHCSCYVHDNLGTNLLEGYVLFSDNTLQKIEILEK